MRRIGGRPLVLLSLILIAGCGDRDSKRRERIPSGLAVGRTVPSYVAVTLEGDTLRLEELHGEVVLLNAWATWCHPCVTELPVLQQLHERFQSQGLRVLGVSIDQDEPDEIRRFLVSHGVTYTNLRDRGSDLKHTFGWGAGIPKSLLIDRQGKVALFWSGGVHPRSSGQVTFLTDTVAALLRR